MITTVNGNNKVVGLCGARRDRACVPGGIRDIITEVILKADKTKSASQGIRHIDAVNYCAGSAVFYLYIPGNCIASVHDRLRAPAGGFCHAQIRQVNCDGA